jgi:hypothetical protein
VESAVGVVAVGRDLDENDDLALHPLEAPDRLEQDLIGFVPTPEVGPNSLVP